MPLLFTNDGIVQLSRPLHDFLISTCYVATFAKHLKLVNIEPSNRPEVEVALLNKVSSVQFVQCEQAFNSFSAWSSAKTLILRYTNVLLLSRIAVLRT